MLLERLMKDRIQKVCGWLVRGDGEECVWIVWRDGVKACRLERVGITGKMV